MPVMYYKGAGDFSCIPVSFLLTELLLNKASLYIGK